MEGERFMMLEAMSHVIRGIEVGRLVDRDGMTDKERAEAQANGFRVLSIRHIESYLFDDEILQRLCGPSDRRRRLMTCWQQSGTR